MKLILQKYYRSCEIKKMQWHTGKKSLQKILQKLTLFSSFFLRFFFFQMISYFNHKILHITGKGFTFRAIYLFEHFVMLFQLMPEPGDIRRAFAKFLPCILGNGASYAYRKIKYSARRTIQYTTIRPFFIYDPLPFFHCGFHNFDLIHNTIPKYVKKNALHICGPQCSAERHSPPFFYSLLLPLH